MSQSSNHRDNAIAIWQAGVQAVHSDSLVRDRLRIHNRRLTCGDFECSLAAIERIVIVGAGKAGAGMASGIESVFANSDVQHLPLVGWVNVPDDCLSQYSLSHVHLHPARQAGKNEPAEAGVAGSEQILKLVQSATARDLVICLISGGGSALMPLPVDGVTWQDKRDVTHLLSSAGADIRELNTVRKQLSAIKGGGLARACQNASMLTLILSDVIGDPLDVIASGPTVPNATNIHDAIQVLKKFFPDYGVLPQSARNYFRTRVEKVNSLDALPSQDPFYQDERGDPTKFKNVTNVILGNNQTALEAAKTQAESLGYSTLVTPTNANEGTAEEVAHHLVDIAKTLPKGSCLISGGEPTVKLSDANHRGRGGRNQQLVLAALVELLEHPNSLASSSDFVLLSGGTDGEDGPTDAAGGILDAQLLGRRDQLTVARKALSRNDAYTLLDKNKALLKTGPTHTNVCDVRVLIT